MRKMSIGFVALLMLATAACGGGGGETTTAPTSTGDAVNGLALYRGTCIVCHGEGGVGIAGLGKPWVGSTFINERTDDEMLAFLLVGRPADDPLNTTGIAMLPKGGNNALTDSDLYDLIAYMRTLNL
jgi:mono/diheme cytochrome c family protein